MLSYTYLFINIFSVFIPIIFSFDTRLDIHKKLRGAFLAIAIVAIPFIAWDIFFTEIGVWGFTDKYLTGLKIFNLPLEEILFFICIPYACIFTYEVIKYFFKEKISEKLSQNISSALISISFLIMIFNLGKFYSSWTFSLVVASLIFLRKRFDFGKFYLSCLFVFPGFFLVNGLLTGIAFPEPVVWYNNLENLGLRFFSIPYDDFFYGFLLMIWNVYLYESISSYLLKKSNK
ncbi:MAG: lycopene cyclase domain-containing protein [Candidatus Caenarcaniphilales bacterium]|nr:lycopene cyclase domain-containing protein [Candidatus Caenarcaniphilales bacterium]